MGVYENCSVIGPSQGKDKRLRVSIFFPNGECRWVSYPKYLMECYLGRYLEKNETVDHIDGNFLNNDISNLQVLDRLEHIKNDAVRNEDIEVTCQMCGKIFTIKGNTLHNRNRKDRTQSGYFCSKTCTGRYGAYVQNGYIKPQKVDIIKPKKYKLKNKK